MKSHHCNLHFTFQGLCMWYLYSLMLLLILPPGGLVFPKGFVLIGSMISKLAKTSHFIILLRVHIVSQ